MRSLRCGRCPPVGPGPLLDRKNRSLASRTSGGALSGDILKTMPFEPKARSMSPDRLQNQKRNGLVGKKDGVRPVEHM
jgi:hypothetical protein